jgi:thiol-disulfide isomerase/thioredoxin
MDFKSMLFIFAVFTLLLLYGCTSTVEIQDPNQTNSTITENVLNNTAKNNTQNSEPKTQDSTDKYDFSPVYTQDGKLIVYFFHAPHCPACKSIAPKVEDIGYRYQNWTEWRGFNINIDKDREIYFQFYNDFNLTPERSGTPMILVNGTILWGQYEINDSLEKIINQSIIK